MDRNTRNLSPLAVQENAVYRISARTNEPRGLTRRLLQLLERQLGNGLLFSASPGGPGVLKLPDVPASDW